MLSEEEQAALDSWRSPCTTYAALRVLADAIDRLYPPGWNDPVTPERLVELGFKREEYQRWYVSPNDMLWWTPGEYGGPAHWRVGGAYIVAECKPRNMQEARQLLERCEAIEETT